MGAQQHWKIGCAAVAMCAVVLMSCVLGGAGIQRGLIPPLDLDLRLGGVRLLAHTTDDPKCPVRRRAGVPHSSCSTGSLFSMQEFYAVWVLISEEQAGRRRETARRILLLPLAP